MSTNWRSSKKARKVKEYKLVHKKVLSYLDGGIQAIFKRRIWANTKQLFHEQVFLSTHFWLGNKHTLSRAHVKVSNLLQNFGNFLLRKKLFLSDKKRFDFLPSSGFDWCQHHTENTRASSLSLSLSLFLSIQPSLLFLFRPLSLSLYLSIYHCYFSLVISISLFL